MRKKTFAEATATRPTSKKTYNEAIEKLAEVFWSSTSAIEVIAFMFDKDEQKAYYDLNCKVNDIQNKTRSQHD
jgi:hypothetical protein